MKNCFLMKENRAQTRTAEKKYLRRQDDPQEEGKAGKGLGGNPGAAMRASFGAKKGMQKK